MDAERNELSSGSETPEIAEVSGAITQSESTPEDNLVAVQTDATKAAAEAALAGIRQRSFSGRNPTLGKMINCQFCGFRHRQFGFREPGFTCGQVFAKDKNGVEQIAGQTKATDFDKTVEADIPAKQFRIQFGAAMFNRKRRNPHKSKRQLQYIRIVRNNLPDLYTKEELELARKIAATSMGLGRKKTYGKYVKEVRNGARQEQ